MQQRVLLRAIDRKVIIPALAGVYKLNIDVVADALKIAVMPYLKGKSRGFAAALFHRPLITSARRVRIGRIRLAKRNIDMTAIRLPARLSSRIVLIGIRN